MERITRQLVAFLLVFCFLLPAAPFVCASEEASSDPDISISIQMVEQSSGMSVIPSLRLTCPAGTSAAGLLEILCDYSYLSGYYTRNGVLIWVEQQIEGETIRYSSPDGWCLKVNGNVIEEGILPILQDGDELCWEFYSEEIDSVDEFPQHELSPASIQNLWDEAHAQHLAQATSWLKSNFNQNETIFCLGVAGVSVNYQKIDRLKESILQTRSYENAMQLAQYILAVTFCGIPATNIEGRNLLEDLSSYPDILADGSDSAAVALIAADSNGYVLPTQGVNTRASLCRGLLSCQNEDGGFAPFVGEPSTVFHTALALSALSGYRQETAVQPAIEDALHYLAQVQNEDGSFPASESHSVVESTGLAVVSLYAAGISVHDQRFSHSADPLEALLPYQTQSGGFSPEIGVAADERSTIAAILALMAAKNNGNIFVLRNPIVSSVLTSSDPLSVPATDMVDIEDTAVSHMDPIQSPYFIPVVGVAAICLGGVLILLIFVRMRRKK